MYNLDNKTLINKFISEIDIDKFVWRYYINTFNEGWSMPDFHNHKAIELIHVLDGHGFMKFNSDVEKISKNNCLLILPESKHQFYVDNNKNCTLINIHFITENTPLKNLGKNTDACFYPGITVPNEEYLKISNSVKLGEIMKKIVDELTVKNTDYKLYVSLSFSELFLELSRICSSLLKSRRSTSKELLKSVIKFIDMNLAEDISPNKIAQELHFTPSYLMHTFKNSMHISVMEYVRVKRIEKSKMMLRNTSSNITTVAQKVGISNSQHFSALFKKYTSMTPKEYRKMALLQNNTDTNIYK
jgi:AraC-like DNA-binding protein